MEEQATGVLRRSFPFSATVARVLSFSIMSIYFSGAFWCPFLSAYCCVNHVGVRRCEVVHVGYETLAYSVPFLRFFVTVQPATHIVKQALMIVRFVCVSPGRIGVKPL